MTHAQRSGVAATALVALAAAASAVAGPPVAQPVPARHSADASFARLEHEYVTYVLERFPVVATYLGGAQFDPQLTGVDGRLRDYSAAALVEEDAALGALRARFAALAPARLSARRRIDRSVALAQIAFLLHQHQVRHLQRRALDSYVDEPVRGVDWQIQGMTATADGHYGTDAEWQLVLARTRAVPAYLASAAQQLRAGVAAHDAPDWRMLVGHGLRSSAAAAQYFADTLPQLAATNVAAPHRAELLRALQGAGAEAAAAYRQLRAFVAATYFEQVPDTGAPLLRAAYRADHFALGETEYDWALHNNLRLGGSAAELYSASWPVVEATRAELIALAQQIAAQHGWPHGAEGAATVRAVFAQLAADAPRTDAEMMDGYRRTGERLVAYAR
ncbi:MAG TPA: DUF885 family protein, partial [Steroidobacteraceae bacterium]|nr:DUF885 family protein [Steroidobacteraceae bacterium]